MTETCHTKIRTMCQSATFFQLDERIKTTLSRKISLSTLELLRGRRRHSGNSDGHLLHPFSGNGNRSEGVNLLHLHPLFIFLYFYSFLAYFIFYGLYVIEGDEGSGFWRVQYLLLLNLLFLLCFCCWSLFYGI